MTKEPMNAFSTSVPLWRQLADILRARIDNGEIAPNAALPSEHKIVEEFGVSRNTTRRAISFLRELGLIETHQGRAATVRTETVQYTIKDTASFASQIRQAGYNLEIEFRENGVIPATPGLARVLNLSLGEAIVDLSARTFVAGSVLSAGRIFHPSNRFPGIGERRRQINSPREMFASYGIRDVNREVTRVAARMASPVEADALELRAPEPVILSRKVDTDEAGRPIEFNETVFVARRINLHFPRAGGNCSVSLDDIDFPSVGVSVHE